MPGVIVNDPSGRGLCVLQQSILKPGNSRVGLLSRSGLGPLNHSWFMECHDRGREFSQEVSGLQAFVKRALENLNVPTELQRRVFSPTL